MYFFMLGMLQWWNGVAVADENSFGDVRYTAFGARIRRSAAILSVVALWLVGG